MTVYLDHNASSPVDPRVLQCFLEVEQECPGNPSSLHRSGRKARAMVEQAREQIAVALSVPPADVFFLSGGTEANNLVVQGAGDPGLPVLLASTEHPSVVEPARVRGSVAWSITADGTAIVTEPTGPVGLICLVHGQNEVGTLQPIGQASALARKLRVPLHVDAAQTLGRIDLREVTEAADTVTLTMHKAGGLRGSAVLVARDGGAGLRPTLRGGGQERGIRAGTVSPALASAAALTVRLAGREWPHRAERMQRARAAFCAALQATGVTPRVLTPLERSLPNTLLLQFDGVDGRSLLPALDLAGVEASQGSACSSGSPSPSPLLLGMGLAERDARACVRFSFGHAHAPDEAAAAGRVVGQTIGSLPRARA